MNKSYNYIVYLVCILIFSSCIKEDLSNCDLRKVAFLNVVLSFDESNLSASELSEMQSATIFVYDENDDFVTLWTIENPELNKEYVSTVKVPTGTYSLVTWFNLDHALYSISPALEEYEQTSPRRADSQFALVLDDKKEVCTKLPLSLYGTLFDLDFVYNEADTFLIPLQQNTNLINITATGLPKNNDQYAFYIFDSNGKYCFKDNFLPCDNFAYKSTTSFNSTNSAPKKSIESYNAEPDVLKTSLVVLQLDETRSPKLVLKDETTQEQLFPYTESLIDNIVDLILLANPTNDFANTHKYDIEIAFDTNMAVSITVNGWKVIDSNNEITPD